MDYSLEENLLKQTYFWLKTLFIPSENNDYQPRFLRSRFLVWAVVLTLTLKIIVICLFLPIPKNLFFADITKIDIVNLLNKNRLSHGLNPLTENRKLDEAAQMKAQDMIANGYFSHQSPRGITPWFWFGRVDYKYVYAGENLAVGFADSKNLYEAWYNSSSHRENLLNPKYSEVGSAVIQGFGDNNAVVVVQLFASPMISSERAENEKQKTENPPSPKSTDGQSKEQEKILNEEINSEEKTSVENTNNGQRVLSQVDQYPLLSAPKNNERNSFYFRFLNFIIYNNDYLRYISYGLIVLTTFSLLFIILNFQARHKKLVFRSLVLIAALFVSISINGSIIYKIFPPQITI